MIYISFVKSINKENLKIARNNIGLISLSASKKILGSSRGLIAEWENGEFLPTWTQVVKLSKLYNISELLFFSRELINVQESVPDYRIGSESRNEEKVRKMINLVMVRQNWLERHVKDGWPNENYLQGSGRILLLRRN